jgi:lipid-A-disaccharide synthase
MLVPAVTFDGVGGPRMQAEGLRSRFPMDELSVMGIAEVLPRYAAPHAADQGDGGGGGRDGPDVLITIDSPDFVFRVAPRVKAASEVRVVHYVAHRLGLAAGAGAQDGGVPRPAADAFPLRAALFRGRGAARGLRGAPGGGRTRGDRGGGRGLPGASRDRRGAALLVLPGSRRGEVTRLAPVFGATVGRMVAGAAGGAGRCSGAGPVAGLVREAVAAGRAPVVILTRRGCRRGGKRAAFRAADAALAASGTVSLELAAADTPMVVAYDMAWLSRQIIGRMLLVDTVTLVNLVSETRVVPEFLGPRCRAELIAPAVTGASRRAGNPGGGARVTMERLGRGGEAPGLRAARAVLGLGR